MNPQEIGKALTSLELLERFLNVTPLDPELTTKIEEVVKERREQLQGIMNKEGYNML